MPSGEQPPDVLYNALGDTVNVAARLQAYAGPGGVVIGPVTANEVRDLFDLEEIGDLEIRGRGGLVQAYRLLGRTREGGPAGDSLRRPRRTTATSSSRRWRRSSTGAARWS